MLPLPKLIAIVGPTASGKTALAERLAKEFDGEILAADSRVVYRGMDIGTAKVLSESKRKSECEYAGATSSHSIYHWLQDLVDPDEPFTVAEWKAAALATIPKVLERKHVPILVGGTGLYVRALIDDFDIPQVPPDPVLRRSLEALSTEDLVARLVRRDPDAAKIVDLKNPRRIIRALEIAESKNHNSSGRPRSDSSSFSVLQIAIDVPRKELYERIDARVDEQVRAGLFVEVEGLAKKYGPDLPALSAIGYRQVVRYLEQECTKVEAIERIKFDTHAYARRQLTWFRRDKRIRWVQDADEAEIIVKKFLGE